MFTSRSLTFLLITFFALGLLTGTSSRQLFSFGGSGTKFKCRDNIICFGGAEASPLEYLALSTSKSDQEYGKALWYKPILLVDTATNSFSSFSTNFSFTIEPGDGGPSDGMTFVILSKPDVPGDWGSKFGLFNNEGGATSHGTLAIEFDTFYNPENGDEDSNHVALDLNTVFSVVARNASEVGIQLSGANKVDRDHFLLVYEFLPNGSLDKALFHPAPGCVLSWKQRFQIILGAAEALYYLHEGWRQQIIHRDFKSSNIMLDGNFNAMLGDFGLARMVEHHENPATTVVAGTYGYIAPEAHTLRKFTEKTDVYAFGAVALEVVCGRAVLNFQVPEDERTLVDWVWKKLEEDDLMSVVDLRLEAQYDVAQVQVLLLVGLLCSHPNPDERLSMRQVLKILSGDVAVPPVPLSKPALEYHISGRHFLMKALNSIISRDTKSETDAGPSSGSSYEQTRAQSDPSVNFSPLSGDVERARKRLNDTR
ncbi:hypothetical protein R1flu_020641 [Riccia fluitans]|uniref:Protein kinase domain-containing protein n=1 Tax=Riccia fluitans TaxID=41844 RepID=A0ABD1ZM30_9MARC